MNRIHMTAIAAIVAGAVTVGGVALSQSGSPSGQPAGGASATSTQATTHRAAQLDALESSLNRQLAESDSAPSAQPSGRIVNAGAGTGHDEGDDHGSGLEPGDDHGSDDD